MKTLFLLLLLYGPFLSGKMYGAVTPPKKPSSTAALVRLAAADYKSAVQALEKAGGRKLAWHEKIVLKGLQKKWKKKWVSREPTERQRKQGHVAMALGIASIFLLLLGSLAGLSLLSLLAFPASIVAIVLGAISLKGNSNTPGIVGLVTGIATIALTLIAILVVLAFWSGW